MYAICTEWKATSPISHKYGLTQYIALKSYYLNFCLHVSLSLAKKINNNKLIVCVQSSRTKDAYESQCAVFLRNGRHINPQDRDGLLEKVMREGRGAKAKQSFPSKLFK